MDQHEAKLLDRLHEYQKLQQDLKECQSDIEELLLIYDFDFETIVQKYPVVKTFYTPASARPRRRIRAWFSQ